jgi:hypothetical protein
MVKIKWALKNSKGEVADSGDIDCDRAVIFGVDKKGNCLLVPLQMPLTEVVGAIRDQGSIERRDFVVKTDKELSLTIETQDIDDKGTVKTERFEYLRAIVMTMDDRGDCNLYPYNIGRIEALGATEITGMLQIVTMGVRSAMAQLAMGPSAAMRGQPPLNLDGMGGLRRNR